MQKIRRILLTSAEIFDAWRVIPRMIITIYGILIYKLYTWFRSMETIEQKSCDSSVLNSLIDRGYELHEASNIACTIMGTTGGPTTEQTAFVSIIIGLGTAIFGLYVNSGRKWTRNSVDDEPVVFEDINTEYDRGNRKRRP